MQSNAACGRRRGLRWRTPTQVGRRGAVAVETAIVLSVLMLMFFAFIQFGWMFLVRHSMLHVAREAARTYALHDRTPAEAIQQADTALAAFGYSTTDFVITAGESGSLRTVTISLPVASPVVSIADIFGLLGSGTMVAIVEMQREGSY